jgi:hypothetical protein
MPSERVESRHPAHEPKRILLNDPSASQLSTSIRNSFLPEIKPSSQKRYQSFEIDDNLVKKHIPYLREQERKINEVLEKKSCDWSTLSSHPKFKLKSTERK